MTTQSPLSTSIVGGGNCPFTAKTGLSTPFGAAVMYDISHLNVFVSALTTVATVASSPAKMENHLTIMKFFQKGRSVDRDGFRFYLTDIRITVCGGSPVLSFLRLSRRTNHMAPISVTSPPEKLGASHAWI